MKKLLITILRVSAGSVFLISGYQKLLEGPASFAAIIRGYQIINGAAVEWVASGLPWIEFILGAFLVLGLWRKAAMLALWCLNTVFVVALSSAFFRHIPLKNCGCFGEAHGLSFTPVQALFFDLFLWVLFFYLWQVRRGGAALDDVFYSHNL